jgi:hypothetical protein
MFSGVPELSFGVDGAEPLRYAAAPTIEFNLVVGTDAGRPISSVLLDVQIQIAARQRPYDADGAHGALLELFGTPDRWGSTLRTLLWTRTTIIVPSFEGSTEVGVPVPCTYDLEVTSGRYFAALSDGEVPLEFLFSGTVFFLGSQGMLQTARISLDHDVAYRLPVSVWREAIERHFPQSAWLRLGREHFDRLCTFKARRGLPSWDATVDALLEGREEP